MAELSAEQRYRKFKALLDKVDEVHGENVYREEYVNGYDDALPAPAERPDAGLSAEELLKAIAADPLREGEVARRKALILEARLKLNTWENWPYEWMRLELVLAAAEAEVARLRAALKALGTTHEHDDNEWHLTGCADASTAEFQAACTTAREALEPRNA